MVEFSPHAEGQKAGQELDFDRVNLLMFRRPQNNELYTRPPRESTVLSPDLAKNTAHGDRHSIPPGANRPAPSPFLDAVEKVRRHGTCTLDAFPLPRGIVIPERIHSNTCGPSPLPWDWSRRSAPHTAAQRDLLGHAAPQPYEPLGQIGSRPVNASNFALKPYGYQRTPESDLFGKGWQPNMNNARRWNDATDFKSRLR
jgi:hypothetical protein